MFDRIIRFALTHRLLVIACTALIFAYGALIVKHLPVDIFPDLNRPVVTIMVECDGMCPEDVEALVSTPVETVMVGIPGVERIRSSSAIGLSMVFVEFGWGTDIFKNRQLVSERLSLVQRTLPKGVQESIGPITSIMGEIQLVGLSSPKGNISPMELRSFADWVVKKRLISLPGIAQVTVMGGLPKQYQVLISAEKVQYYGLSLEDLQHSLSHLSQNTSGGYYQEGNNSLLVRNIGAVESVEDIQNSVVGFHLGNTVLVKDIAVVKVDGPPVRFGDGSVNGVPSVLLTVRKQPDTNTVELTKEIARVLDDLEGSLPEGITIHKDLFKQATFIETSIQNLREVLRDGAIIVAIVLFLFLLNFRTTLISLTVIPVSFMLTLITFKIFGMSVNTMTLGGLAIAIGELVDDAIVDMENVFRRLKENRRAGNPISPLRVVYLASLEVRSSIIFATLIVAAVFIPLFYLEGLEGRFFIPLGIAYIVSLIASLGVSLTLTPVLCSYLLPNAGIMERQEGWLVRSLKNIDRKTLTISLDHPKKILFAVLILFVMSLGTLFFMGSSFLPEFQEGTAMISVIAPPGTSLEASNAIGKKAELLIMEIPEVKSVSRRTGRAQEDEHVHGSNISEIDVDFHKEGRPRAIVLNEIRQLLKGLEGVFINIGQPIEHRIDHMMSGVNAQLAIKLFGPDLGVLRQKAYDIYTAIKDVDGLVDLQIEPQTLIPQTKIRILRDLAADAGIMVGALASGLEMALHGETVAQVLENQKTTDIIVRLDHESRANLSSIQEISARLKPDGQRVKLGDVADVYVSKGPNEINHEDQRRRIIVQANSSGRDIGSIVHEIKNRIETKVDLPEQYYVSYDGQFKAQQEASMRILLLSLFSLVVIFVILWTHFSSAWLSVQVLITIPLAMIGALFAIYISSRVLSIATLIGLVTLCGIAARNTIMMLSHYIHLVKEEGEGLTKEMVIRGSLERLVPVLMTSLTAMLALIPLAIASGEAGKEILHPLSVVIIGGLISSTLLDMIVTPTVFYNFGREATRKALAKNKETL